MPKLTDRFLAALKVENGRKDRLVFDTACPGLGVRVTTKGTRTFIAQWTDPVTRRKVREPIGVWGNITIDKAREAAQILLGDVARRINPKAERERQRAEAERESAELALTFDALIEEWKALHLAHRRARYAAEAERAIRCGLPTLLKRPAARISRADAVNALDQIVKAGKAVTAGRTMAYARACFAWGKRRGKVPENPFAELPISAGATERERVLSDTETAEVWAAADTLGYPFGPFYKLMILTLQRREEVAGMRWSEIADDMSRWTLPGSRMKNGKPHDVHLSEAGARGAAVDPEGRGVRSGVHHYRLSGQRPRFRAEWQAQDRAAADIRLFAGQALPRCGNRQGARGSRRQVRAGSRSRLLLGACMICGEPGSRRWRRSVSTASLSISCWRTNRGSYAGSPGSTSATISPASAPRRSTLGRRTSPAPRRRT